MVSPAPESGKPAAPHAASRQRQAGLWSGIALFVALLVLPTLPAFNPAAQRTAGIALLMAIWWMTEALPLPVTALVPLVLFPLVGVLAPTAAAAPYANPVIFLFLGGFVLALSMERWGLHRRIALTIVGVAGARPASLVLGFMVATAFLSMWISNTATTAMMAPIGIAIAELLRPDDGGSDYRFGTALLLGIAYAASIGGVGTLIGTPPNAVFAGAAQEILGRQVGFAEWMLVAMPLVIVMLPLTWALLVFVFFPPGPLSGGADVLLARERSQLAAMNRGERLTLIVFVAMALAWVFRESKPLGPVTIPGLEAIAPGIDDSTIAITGVILLFLLPVDARRGEFVMSWEKTRDLPWGVLLLFGGGLSLARGFEESGLTLLIGEAVAGFGGVPGWMLLAIVAITFILLSELASNTAIAAMAMPVIAAAAIGLGQSPLVFMATAALAASQAFMLPVATPPNAIVFGTGYIEMRQMMRAGIGLNLLAIVLVTIVALLLAGPILG
jgi:sodium-dependent dicarboxylate transporter 2/3/5